MQMNTKSELTRSSFFPTGCTDHVIPKHYVCKTGLFKTRGEDYTLHQECPRCSKIITIDFTEKQVEELNALKHTQMTEGLSIPQSIHALIRIKPDLSDEEQETFLSGLCMDCLNHCTTPNPYIRDYATN